MAKVGRPTDYCKDKADYICEKLSDGQSLKAICEPDDMPTRSTIYRWLGLHPEFSNMYDRAREEQAETLADEIIAIADESYDDIMIDDNGNQRQNTEFIQRSRLRVDARKWVASKLKPRKYGEARQIDHTSSDGSMTPQEAGPTVIEVVAPTMEKE
jgi:hypothetical protein